MEINLSYESTTSHSLIFGTMVGLHIEIQFPSFIERTKKNFSFDAVAANTRPPYDSVGGTDYAKPKNYDSYGTQSASRVAKDE
jgi:hypothetical protein